MLDPVVVEEGLSLFPTVVNAFDFYLNVPLIFVSREFRKIEDR